MGAPEPPIPGGGRAERGLQAELASLAAAIERAAGDLALAEEPARFVAALEDGAPDVARTTEAPA